MSRLWRVVLVVGVIVLAVPAVAAAATPTASLTVTQYSRILRGNIGEAVSGVSVTATLERPVAGVSQTVAQGTATTDGQGNWSTTLAPVVSGDPSTYGQPGDAINLTYSGPSGTTLPADGTFGGPTFLGNVSTIESDGSAINTNVGSGSCSEVEFLVNGSALSTQSLGSWCFAKPATALTNTDNVFVQFTSTVTDPQSGASITMITTSRAGLVGVGSGTFSGGGNPTCGADLVTAKITCVSLDSGSYTLTSSAGKSYPLTSSEIGSFQGKTEYAGTAVVSGLESGQSFTLTRSGLSRTLSSFTVPKLVDHIALNGGQSGTCMPFKQISSTGSGNAVCPQSGTFSGLAGGLSIYDELNGASATATIPTLSDLIPAQDASVPGADFFAYATLVGAGGPQEVMQQFRSVTFSVISHDRKSHPFTGTMTRTRDASGPYASIEVKNLAAGLYYGDWKMTDRNGDTRIYENMFAAQPPGAPARAISLSAWRRLRASRQ